MNTIQEIPRPLRNTKVIQPVVFRRATTRPYLFLMRLVQIFVAYCSKNSFSNIHPLIPLSVMWYLFTSLIPNLFTRFFHVYSIYSSSQLVLLTAKFWINSTNFCFVFHQYTCMLVVSKDVRTYRHVDV